MEVICQNCSKRLLVPDEKLPQKGLFYITCPQCKEKITVNLKKESLPAGEDVLQQTVIPPREGGELPSKVSTTSEAYSEILKTVLICEDNHERQNEITSILRGMNYKVDVSQSTYDAFDKIRFTQYDVIVLNENFDGSSPENNEVLEHLQNMPMNSRRNIFLALMGQNLKTLDNAEAFSKSVNAVINAKDLSNLKSILTKSIQDHERFYRILKDILKELGKV